MILSALSQFATQDNYVAISILGGVLAFVAAFVLVRSM